MISVCGMNAKGGGWTMEVEKRGDRTQINMDRIEKGEIGGKVGREGRKKR